MTLPIPNSFADLPAPLPQVGAILHLDTRLPQKDIRRGNQSWRLGGSCVLADRARILTIHHVLESSGRVAAFFPYYGIFLINREGRELENGGGLDALVLADLDEAVGAAPLDHLKVSSHYKNRGFATACGFGFWHGTGLDELDGIQQRYRVNLGAGCRGRRVHYDNLDLIWTSQGNSGVAAGRGNSGGPLLWGTDQKVHPEADGPPRDWNGDRYRYVAITRERIREGADCDLQVSSWIGWDRKRWLDTIGNGNGGFPKATFQSRIATVAAGPGAKPLVVDFQVPEGATRVCCTLSASRGLRLQMKLDIDSGHDWLDGIGLDNSSSGRFLVREAALRGNQRTVSVGVAPVERAPKAAEQAIVQICCRSY